MVHRRRKPMYSFLFAAAVLVHFNVFGSFRTVEETRFSADDNDSTLSTPTNDASVTTAQSTTSLHSNHNRSTTESSQLMNLVLSNLDNSNSNHNGSSKTTTREEPVHLVYAADDDDESIRGVEQSIRSVMHYASEPVVFHFVGEKPLSSSLDHVVTYYDLKTVTAQYNLNDFTNPKKRFGKKRKTLNSSLANYVRFIMDSLLPQNVSKAMWIDADTIVKCDVVPMVRNALLTPSSSSRLTTRRDNNSMTMTTKPYAIAAVSIPGKPQSLSRYAQSKFKGITQTFNAGVFVVNLDQWREQRLTEQIRKVSLLNKKKKLYRLGSQPPLTLVVGNNFEHLDPAWNVKVPLIKEYFKDYGPTADVCLLHWVGGRKPWDRKQNLKSTHKEWWNKYTSTKRITADSLKEK